MVFINVWLKLVVNKHFAVYQCAHAWQIEILAETNFVETFGRAKQVCQSRASGPLVSVAMIQLLERSIESAY